jgi:hypothetical protein
VQELHPTPASSEHRAQELLEVRALLASQLRQVVLVALQVRQSGEQAGATSLA